jgi:hypothetical protein
MTDFRHPRGAFRVRDTYPGVAMFRSFTCCGMFEERQVPDRYAGDGVAIWRQMLDNLSEVCPDDGHKPDDCPFEAWRYADPGELGLKCE